MFDKAALRMSNEIHARVLEDRKEQEAQNLPRILEFRKEIQEGKWQRVSLPGRLVLEVTELLAHLEMPNHVKAILENLQQA